MCKYYVTLYDRLECIQALLMWRGFLEARLQGWQEMSEVCLIYLSEISDSMYLTMGFWRRGIQVHGSWHSEHYIAGSSMPPAQLW